MKNISPQDKMLWRIAETIIMMKRARKYLIQDWGKEVYEMRLTNLQNGFKLKLKQRDESNVD
jgi:hypothetical protein